MPLPLLLVTNDDGVDSFFLHALCAAHRPFFHVCVVAPAGEQSWVGRSFSRLRPVAVESRRLGCADEAWAVDGTPSDCVNIALGSLLHGRRPAAVISGVNIGYNITMPLCLSSGTLAGALEGAAWRLPAAAFSLELPDSEYLHAQRNKGEIGGVGRESLLCAASRAVGFTRLAIAEAGALAEAALRVHNVNFPRVCTESTPVERTVPAVVRSGSLYREVPGNPGVYRFHWDKTGASTDFADGTDAACIGRGHISHSIFEPAA
ncbi:MAG: 5'/3'-nucleotidase SurE [Puniceicoccales bacterium]|jgi:5'-nucleotidase|nr:5'/3'-nucleotidase SurE [Puniceicoccales bacterium]